MKLIHTGDWHLGKLLNGYSLLDDQRRWIDSLLCTLERERPDVLLIAGDVFDRGVPPAAAITLLGEALHAMRQLDVSVLMISGNHDAGERLEFAQQLLWESGVYIAGSLPYRPVRTGAAKPSDPAAEQDGCDSDQAAGSLPPGIKKVTLSDAYGAVHFYLLPHTDRHLLRRICGGEPTDSFSQLFHAYCQPMLDTLDTTARNVLMAHGFFALGSHDLEYNGVSVGGSEKIDLTPFVDFDYIALGHLHAAKGTGLSQAQYAGSPMKYSIAEASQTKTCWLLDLGKKGSLQKSLLTIPLPRDVTVRTGLFADLLAEGESRATPLSDYVFFHLLDAFPVTDVVLRLKPYYPYLLGVTFPNVVDQTPQQKSFATEVLSDPLELFATFYEESTESPLTPTQAELLQTAILDTGIR